MPTGLAVSDVQLSVPRRQRPAVGLPAGAASQHAATLRCWSHGFVCKAGAEADCIPGTGIICPTAHLAVRVDVNAVHRQPWAEVAVPHLNRAARLQAKHGLHDQAAMSSAGSRCLQEQANVICLAHARQCAHFLPHMEQTGLLPPGRQSRGSSVSSHETAGSTCTAPELETSGARTVITVLTREVRYAGHRYVCKKIVVPIVHREVLAPAGKELHQCSCACVLCQRCA